MAHVDDLLLINTFSYENIKAFIKRPVYNAISVVDVMPIYIHHIENRHLYKSVHLLHLHPSGNINVAQTSFIK